MGFTAPSSTRARTRSGNSSAYVSAESGAVGESHVGELFVSERVAQRIEVAGGVVRADVRFQRQRVGGADLGPGLGFGEQPLPAGIVAGLEQRHVVVEVDLALDRRALADTTRIERHQIEAVGDGCGDERSSRGQELDAGPSRSTRVEHQ